MRRIFGAEDVRLIREEYESNLSIRQLAKEWDCSFTAIRNAILRATGELKCRGLKKLQVPGQSWVFKCGHACSVLPSFGDSNNSARWTKADRGWRCAVCVNKRDSDKRCGLGPEGLLGCMRCRLKGARASARRRGYKAPNITPKELVLAWESQFGRCAWTNEELEIGDAFLEHDHDTGEFRGFVKPSANSAEGYLNKLSFEGRVNLFIKVYPAEIEKVFLGK